MCVLNQHKWTTIAATLLQVYKSYKLVTTLTFTWSFSTMSLETGLFTRAYLTKMEYIFATYLVTSVIALVVQVISNSIILVGLFKKNANKVKAGLKPSAVCLTIEFLAFMAYLLSFAVEWGFRYTELKTILFTIIDESLQLVSALALLMIRKYYLKMRYEANILQDEANMKQEKPEFKVLI